MAPHKTVENVPLSVCSLLWRAGVETRVVAEAPGHTLAAVARLGKGHLLVLATSGVASRSQAGLLKTFCSFLVNAPACHKLHFSIMARCLSLPTQPKPANPTHDD